MHDFLVSSSCLAVGSQDSPNKRADQVVQRRVHRCTVLLGESVRGHASVTYQPQRQCAGCSQCFRDDGQLQGSSAVLAGSDRALLQHFGDALGIDHVCLGMPCVQRARGAHRHAERQHGTNPVGRAQTGKHGVLVNALHPLYLGDGGAETQRLAGQPGGHSPLQLRDLQLKIDTREKRRDCRGSPDETAIHAP